MKLAISACLNGENCTFSASNNNDDFVRKHLNKYFDFFHFCPEVNILGAPRETIRLVNFSGNTKVISNKTSKDFTDDLILESRKIVSQIRQNNDICGVILKSKSPTCGLERVKLYMPSGIPDIKTDMGILAKELKASFPLLPIEENNRLIDPWLRENFVMQIYAYKDFELFKRNNPNMGKLVEFHTGYKYLIMSKSNESYKRLGNIVANRNKTDFQTVLDEYEVEFKMAIQTKSSIKKTINVLEHCYGYVKNDISDIEKQSFFESLDNFKNKLVPLILPLSILQMFINKHNCKYLQNQKFFSPYPKDLALRSDINSLK